MASYTNTVAPASRGDRWRALALDRSARRVFGELHPDAFEEKTRKTSTHDFQMGRALDTEFVEECVENAPNMNPCPWRRRESSLLASPLGGATCPAPTPKRD